MFPDCMQVLKLRLKFTLPWLLRALTLLSYPHPFFISYSVLGVYVLLEEHNKKMISNNILLYL